MLAAVDSDTHDVFLMQQVVAGDGEAFRELFDRRGPVVLGVLVRIVRSRESAEEILQEVFLQVWRLSRSYNPEKASPMAWLLMLARSRAIDYLRSRQALCRREEAGAWQAAEEPPPSADHLDTQVLERRVRRAMKNLPAPQRTSVELAFFAGLSHSQIADRLAAPLGTVKSRIQLGLRRLRLDLSKAPAPKRTAARAGLPSRPLQAIPAPHPLRTLEIPPQPFRDGIFSALEHLDRQFGLFSAM
jgi:RNA polymerase sigma-70 factor (ECF subfamily)